MPIRRLILASASPARLNLLRQAGFAPEVIVSGVDEDAIDAPDTAALVDALAQAKADVVAGRPEAAGALVIGCDSMFEIDGRSWGKPASPVEAIQRITSMQGRSGRLHTGHCLIDTESGRRSCGVGVTTVKFATMRHDEIERYVATGEPLAVAGAFTLDGRASVFVEGVEGDPSNVIGLSLPLLRRLLAELGVEVTDLWT